MSCVSIPKFIVDTIVNNNTVVLLTKVMKLLLLQV